MEGEALMHTRPIVADLLCCLQEMTFLTNSPWGTFLLPAMN